MRTVKSPFLDFVRLVVKGETKEVSRRLAASPSLATEPAVVARAARPRGSSFSQKSLTISTPATRRSTWRPRRFNVPSRSFWLLTVRIATRGIGAERNPFTTRPTPTTGTQRRRQRRSNTFCRSAQIPTRWIGAAWRLCTEPCERGRCRRSRRCSMAARTRVRRTRRARRPCTSPFRPPGAAEAVPSTHESSRRASSSYCWNAAHSQPTRTREANRFDRRRRVIGFALCSSKRLASAESTLLTKQTAR